MLKRVGSNFAQQPMRYIGNATAGARQMWTRGERFNQSIGQGISDKTAGIPPAYRPPTAWVLPYVAGAIKATSEVSGSGTISAEAWAVRLIEASLNGDGTLTATGGLIVQLVAAITGNGDITNADVKAFLQAVANIGGTGSVTATLLGQAAAAAGLTGSGSVSPTLTGRGNMGAALTVTGTGLSTANVGAAVWAKVIEGGESAEELMRLIRAVLMGQTEITGTTAVFKSKDGTVDRVTAQMSGSERTDVDVEPN